MKRIIMRDFISIVIIVTLLNLRVFVCTGQGTEYQQITIENGLSSSAINCFYQDSKGFLWIGTQEGLNQYSGLEVVVFNKEMSNANITALEEDNQSQLWIGTKSGLNILDLKTHVIKELSQFKGEYISDIQQNRRGDIIVAAKHAKELYFIKDQSTFEIDTIILPAFNPSRMTLDLDGNVWIASQGDGVLVLDQSGRLVEDFSSQGEQQFLFGNNNSSLLTDSRGAVWIGDDDGMLRGRTKDGTFVSYDLNEFNRPGCMIKSIAEHLPGELWVVTSQGVLSVIDIDKRVIESGHSSSNWPKQLKSSPFNVVYGDRMGNMWIGTRAQGVKRYSHTFNKVQFDPDSVELGIKNELQVVFSDLKIFSNSVLPGDSSNILKFIINEQDSIVLNHTQSVMSLDFSVLDLSTNGNHRYDYMMEGLDEDWNHVGTNNSVTYAHLPTGEYLQFKVKLSGQAIDKAKVLTIMVLTPWWDRIEFKLVSIFLFCSMIYAIYHWREKIASIKVRKMKLVIREKTREIEGQNAALQVQREKLDLALASANEANAELETFSYSVSHDLRAPLRAIDGFSKIILEEQKGGFSAESKRLFGVIITNSEKMGRLIDAVLEFARVSRKSLNKKEVSLKEMVNDIIHEHNYEKSIFKIEIDHNIFAEHTLIKQAVSNLIDNAHKYSSKEEDPRITISSRFTKQGVKVEIKDNGAGFNMVYYDQIFGVFKRLHTEEEFSGTGVGLAITKKIILAHQGELWAQSEEGMGTSFYFILPIAESIQIADI